MKTYISPITDFNVLRLEQSILDPLEGTGGGMGSSPGGTPDKGKTLAPRRLYM